MSIQVTARSAWLVLSFTSLSAFLSPFLSVRSLLLPSLYYLAILLTSHVPPTDLPPTPPSALSPQQWRTKNSGGPLRRTWARRVPVQANKPPKIPAPSPIPAIHIFSKCECDVGALQPEEIND
jgi:hypothetical protein